MIFEEGTVHTLVYVDRKLAVAMAVRLIGLQLHRGQRNSAGGAFNWIIQAYVSRDENVGFTTDIRELLPEEVMYEVYEAIDDEFKFEDVEKCIEKMAEIGENQLLPGRPISVQGVLKFPDLQELGAYNPFEPPDIEVKTFQFHGEKCFVGQIHGNGFRLPVYFDEASKAQVAFCNENPVEVTGIVRWSPPYSPKGARSLGLVIRTAALWLR